MRTRVVSAIVRIVLAALLLPFALDWRSPLLASVRPSALVCLIVVPCVLIAAQATETQEIFERAVDAGLAHPVTFEPRGRKLHPAAREGPRSFVEPLNR